jgi:hypothetical protein
MSLITNAQFTAHAELDSANIIIGKQATLTLELRQPSGSKIMWPQLPDTLGKIEIISRGKIDTTGVEGGSLKRSQSIRITAFDSGYFVIPPIGFHSAEKNDTAVLAQTNPLLLAVHTIPVDTTKAFRDIRNIAEIPFDWRDYINLIIIIISALILIAIGIYIYNRIRKNKKVPGFFKPEPVIPPHEAALAALKEIDNAKYWQNGQYKFYHSAISDVIRNYIEKGFNVPAMEQTSDEIFSGILYNQLNAETRAKLNYILRTADLAKFAKLQPLAHENEQSMRNAVDFIKETMPVDLKEESVK